MRAYLEIWKPSGRELHPLEGERVSIGRTSANDIVVPGDLEVSRLHAVLERFPSGWCVRDLGSSNGTFVQGRRLAGERVLQNNDEIRIGSTRLHFRVDPTGSEEEIHTLAGRKPPELTRREREVLVALCRTTPGSEAFTEPASIRQIATELFITEAGVKQHLMRLYEKFEIHERGERRRVRLANEAFRRGAVSVAELSPTQERPSGPPGDR
jgi:DNA-binding CsgD family transcriptional regulator